MPLAVRGEAQCVALGVSEQGFGDDCKLGSCCLLCVSSDITAASPLHQHTPAAISVKWGRVPGEVPSPSRP